MSPAGLKRALRRDPLSALESLAREGDVVRFSWDDAPVVLFNHPDSVCEVLLTQQKNFVRSGGPARLSALLGNGLLRSQGETHLRQRRLSQPAFHGSQLAHYGNLMTRLALEHTSAWREDKRIDFHQEMSQLTLAIAAKAFFGMQGSGEISETGRAIQRLIGNLRKGPSRWNEWHRARRFDRARRQVDGTLYAFINERRRDSAASSDLLSRLVEARDAETDGTGMSDPQLRDELMTLLVAGHETTASALAWAGYLLATSAQAQGEMQTEIARELGGATPSLEAVERLPYTRGVFAESLRLYPPAWILFRRALEACQVGDTSIRQGEHVLLSPYLMGRDPRYFPEPLVFRPERWRHESRLPKGAFFPFGLGNRKCLGEQFAWNEGILILAVLGQRFSLALSPRARVSPAPLFTLRPKRGLPLRVSRLPQW